MAADAFINFNEFKFQHKQSPSNFDGGNRRNFSKVSNPRCSDEEKGRFSDEGDPADLYNALRSFLKFGRFIGLIPINGLFQRDVDKLTFNKLSFPAFVSVIMMGIMSVNVAIEFVGLCRGTHKNPGEYAWASGIFLFYAIGLFAFVYFYRHAWDYIHVLRKWNKMNLTFYEPDKTLVRDLNMVACLVMTSAVLENALFSINDFPVLPVANDSFAFIHRTEPDNATALEIYYIRSNKNWADIVPFHPLVAIFLFLSNKFALYAWNYLDLTIAFMSRAMYHKFKALHTQGEASLICTCSGYDSTKWEQLMQDFEILNSMLDQIATFLSPIVFCSFGMNIYAVCIQLHLGLTSSNQTLAPSIYAVWAILHLVIRVYIIALCATRINDWAHRLGDIFRKCPSEAYITGVERAERFFGLNTVGLNGLGCFVVTKPLMLQLAGVVLTFEIVLLQFSQSTHTEHPCK